MCLYPEEAFKASVLFIPSDPQGLWFYDHDTAVSSHGASPFTLSSALTLLLFDTIHLSRSRKASKLPSQYFSGPEMLRTVRGASSAAAVAGASAVLVII